MLISIEKRNIIKKTITSRNENHIEEKKQKERTESFLIPQDFDFLRRGGRLTPMAAALGSVLKLKPSYLNSKKTCAMHTFFILIQRLLFQAR